MNSWTTGSGSLRQRKVGAEANLMNGEATKKGSEQWNGAEDDLLSPCVLSQQGEAAGGHDCE